MFNIDQIKKELEEIKDLTIKAEVGLAKCENLQARIISGATSGMSELELKKLVEEFLVIVKQNHANLDAIKSPLDHAAMVARFGKDIATISTTESVVMAALGESKTRKI